RISVLPLGVDPVPDFRNADNFDEEVLKRNNIIKPYLLYVGVFQPRKNIEGMINAFRLFKKTDTGNVRLVLAGKTGWLYQKICTAVQADEITRTWVSWLGYVSDQEKWALYRNARALVFPSFYEGFGIPAVESMKCGTPVLYANCSSLPEVVGEAGIGFDPYCTENMADAMSRIVNDDALHQSLHLKSIERSRNFSWDQSAHTLMTVLNTVGEG
ncbi:MAG: glycosyltransferase, partial [Elusimicrobia bacterium]|nr:glycosyltransferase [Elusimicrobiota bacterium]MBD3411556.1 glycosyltransferase [Elusimicrobiota bacterium]